MKPSDKNPAIDTFIKKTLGIDRQSRIRNSMCAVCQKDITRDSFRDAISLKEYTISGMCQECQDSVFGR